MPTFVDVNGSSVLVTAIVAGDPIDGLFSRALLVDLAFAIRQFEPDGSRTILVRSERPISAESLELATSPISPEGVAARRPEALVEALDVTRSSADPLARALGWALTVAGGFTVSLMLFSSTRARTAELAVRRIFGASPVQLASMPIAEAVLLGLLGGALGALIGEIGAVVWSSRVDAHYSMDLTRVSNAVLITTCSAAIAASIPAIYALRVDPVDALVVQ